MVANAGGINLLACTEMVKKVASEEGIDLSVAMVTGDDLMKKVGVFVVICQWRASHSTSGKGDLSP